MGCSGSKEEELPLVMRCRERRELIRAAANHRYALAASHVSYFRSLREVGDALRKFVDEELITSNQSSSSSPSNVSSPSLILPQNSKKKIDDDSNQSHLHDHDHDEEDDDSHIHLSSDEDDDSGTEDGKNHNHKEHNSNGEKRDLHEEVKPNYPNGNFNGYGFPGGSINDPYSYPYSYPPPPATSYGDPYADQYNWGPPPGMQPWNYSNYSGNNSNVYYMKKSAPATRTVFHRPPEEPSNGYSDSYWNIPGGYGGNYGYIPPPEKVAPPKEPPPPPPPENSAWDFFNPFDVADNGYPGYYSSGRNNVYASNSSSPDSTEVRKMEGIPDLEEETESEVYNNKEEVSRSKGKKNFSSKKTNFEAKRINIEFKGESSSRSIPSWSSDETVKLSSRTPHSSESAKRSASPLHSPEIQDSSSLTDDENISPETIVSKSVDEGSLRKKGVSFEVDNSNRDFDSNKLSSFTVLSPNGNRDLREVVAEIRDEFEVASSYGKEVAVLLEVGKLPYQPGFIKVLLSRILYPIIPSLSLRDPPSIQSVKLASRTVKMAKSYFEDVGKDVTAKACNLSSTMDQLYAWEKKLYKEVKGEERLRLMYEKQCRRLKHLDEKGAETSKIEATQASIGRLLTKIDVSIKAIDAISSRIHKLRDEELQPQVAALIQGMIRMWKAMLKCHQKQFHAIMDSKMRKLKANTNIKTDQNSRATTNLERELHSWCDHFNDWVNFQKSYVESLNNWLVQCLSYNPEITPDGPSPYSPGRIGAPPIFVICNDWQQAMEAISEARVANAMNNFATGLRQLWEKQDEEERQRVKAEFLKRDFERHLKTQGGNNKRGKKEQHDHDSLSLVTSDSGVSPLDDLKVDLDSMRQRLAEERVKHKDAMKLVHDAASSSLQGGLIPIFKALESFTSEALRAHEHVRLQQETDNV